MRIQSGIVRWIVALVIVLSLAACDKPESKIVGKWRIDEHQTLEFFPDKTLVLATPVNNFSGIYTFVSGDRIKMEFSGIIIGLAGPQIARVSFESGDLVLDGDANSSLFSGQHVLKRIGG
ncbi:MAG TPA: hypothetical protein VI732_05445 [Alphaproteobacteria bacterium]|nr:hypothetical protein [Alphaproteobacteria bacterium]